MMKEAGNEATSGAVKLPDAELIHQALRFLFWGAGQGFSPVATDDAPEPEEALWQYSLRTDDEDWESLADRYKASIESKIAVLEQGRVG